MGTGRSQRHLREIYGRDSTGWTEGGLKPNIPSGAIVVSADSYEGIPAGNDTTGNGSPLKPYATLAKALTVVAENQTIVLNGNPTAPSIYTAGTFFNITKGMTIDGIWPNGAYLRGTGAQTRVVNVAPTAGQTVRFGKIVVDGQSAIGSCILFSDQAVKYRVELLGTVCTGWTTQAVASSASATATKIDLLVDGAMLLGAAMRSGIYFKGLIEGSVIVRRSQITLSTQNASGHGFAIVWAKATGCQFEFTDNIAYLTIDGVTGTSTTYGVQVQNIPNAKIQRNQITIDSTGLANTRPGEAVQVCATSAAPLTSSGALVTGNTIVHKANGGMGIEIGEDNQDSGSRGFQNGAVVEGNTVWCNDFSKAGTTHGIFNGSGGNSIVRRNIVQNSGIALADKEGDGARFYNNIVIDASNSMLRLKGSKNARFTHNTVHKTLAAGTPILVSNNSTNSHVGSGCVIEGNLISSKVTTVFVSAEEAEACAFNHNDYHSSASAAANPWSWGVTNYASLSAWGTAHEEGCIAVNPQFLSPEAMNYHPSPAATQLDVAPFDTDVQFDYANYLYTNPATVGAYQRLPA